jgi:hypothetical protein
MNPFMQQVVNPVQQALQQQQGQQLAQQQAEAIRGGAFGGERAGLQRQVLRGQQQLGMGQALSPLYQQGYGQALQAAQGDLGRQLQAGQALGALGTGAQTAALQAPQALLGAGTLEQQTQQAGLSALYNQFLQERAYPYQQAQFYSNVAGGLGPLLGQQTFQSQAQNPFGMFLSEPDAKMGVDSYADGGFAQDRSQPDVVGKTFDDQNIYAYRYKDGGPAHLGLMADEVQQAHPEAVGYAPTGDRMVDYAAATDAAARMGGAVKDTGDYARGGYAIGGHLSYVDPSDPGASDRRRMDALLASHKGGLSGAASEYGPSGQSYVTQKTYVPAGTVRAGQQLQHASFSPMQRQGGIGSALEMGEKLGGLLSKGYEAYDKYKVSKWPGWGGNEPKMAAGGLVPTSYIPEEITGEVRTSQGLRPAEFAGREREESGLNKLMSVGEKALDAGIKYGPLLAKGATMLAAMSEPGMKTGVRSGYAEGGESNFIDNLINALSGHGYITGETWERPQREVATREPMELHPAARSKGVVPSISPEQYRYERRMAERNMAPSLTEEQYQQELEMGRNNMRTERPMIAGSRGIVPSNRFTPDLDRELAMGRHNMEYPTLAEELEMGRRNIEYPTLAEELEMGRRNMAPSLTEEEADRELAMGRQNMMAHGGRTGYATVGGVRPENEDDIFERGILGAESAYKQFDKQGRPLTSPAGAIGIAQVMPGTAPEAAKLAGLEFDPVRYRTDADYNAALGRAYYNKQFETFGSKDKAAAAYNAGPYAVQKALARAEREGGDYLSYLPAETRAYVPKVMGLGAARGEEESSPRITPSAVARAKEGLRLDRMAGSFTPEQRSMMALDESSKEGLGAAKTKDKDFLDTLTSEEFLLPALTGLGTAAATAMSAPTTSLGAALAGGAGAGIAAGAKSTMDVQKQRAEIGKIGAEEEEQRALANLATSQAFKELQTAFKDSFFEVQGVPMVHLADGGIMRFDQWMRNPKDVIGGSAATSAALKMAGASGSPTGAKLEAEPATTKQSPLLGEQTPVKPVPGVNFNPKSAEQEANLIYGPNKNKFVSMSDNYYTNTQKEAQAAAQQKLYSDQIALEISKAARQHLLSAPGSGAEWRAALVGALNTIVRMVPGAEEVVGENYFGDAKSNKEILDKLTLLRGNKNVDQNSLGALERSIAANPQYYYSPEGAIKNVATIMVEDQKPIDRRDHMELYGQSSGVNSYAGASSEFDKSNDSRKYQQDIKALETILAEPGDKNHLPGWKVLDLARSGGVSADNIEEYIRNYVVPKYSKTDKGFKYVPGISRFFIGKSYAQ